MHIISLTETDNYWGRAGKQAQTARFWSSHMCPLGTSPPGVAEEQCRCGIPGGEQETWGRAEGNKQEEIISISRGQGMIHRVYLFSNCLLPTSAYTLNDRKVHFIHFASPPNSHFSPAFRTSSSVLPQPLSSASLLCPGLGDAYPIWSSAQVSVPTGSLLL